jgi:DDE superfamily endonuclease
MVKDFDTQTREKANGEYRVLLMDGHSSHYTLEILQYAKDNKIIILGYPPHCTHVLQGLDVVCFAKMKSEFRREIQAFEDLHFSKVTKSDFAGVFGRAFLRAFTPDTIKAAFAATGVFPFNPDIIPEKALKPSLPTSIKGSFPLPQPSPVKAILSVMGSNPPTNFDLSPSHNVPGPSRIIPTSPVTPSRRPRSPAIDPSLESPSKKIRMLYSALSSTSSGSLLISNVKMTSSYKIPEPVLETVPDLPQPNWALLRSSNPGIYQSREALEQRNRELVESLAKSRDIIRARELIDEGRAAQLVIQNAILVKQNKALHTKENKKDEGRTKLFADGFGRHLTDPELIQTTAAERQKKKDKEAEKAKRKSDREADAKARAEADTQWEKIKADHEKALEEWKTECDRLKAEGA